MLAKQGKKVVLVDLDLGAPNLHTMMGIDNLKTGLNNFLNNSVKDLSLTAVPTKIPNLYIISSIRCSLEVGNLFYAQKQKINSRHFTASNRLCSTGPWSRNNL